MLSLFVNAGRGIGGDVECRLVLYFVRALQGVALARGVVIL